MKTNRIYHQVLISIVLIYLLIPLAATFMYAIANEWQNTLLPKSWTLHWFTDMFQDARFIDAMSNSLLVCTISVLLSLVIMLPTIFIVTVYFPKWEYVLNALAILPYAIPGVIAAVGLIKIYSTGPLAISGTIYILIGAYFVAILPYTYQGIRNSLRTVNAVQLIDAAELLGASKWQAFVRVVFPNIAPGITVSVLLSFSILFGEFVLANLLVGSRFETIQIYLYNRLDESGHLASAVAITYFVIVLLISGGIAKFNKWLVKNPKLN